MIDNMNQKWVENTFPKPWKLDLGCGRAKKEGYIGIDCFSDPQVDIVMDLFGTFTWGQCPEELGVSQNDYLEILLDYFPEGSVDAIHAHHVIEHIPWKTAYRVIYGWIKTLKSGGTILLACPDLGYLCSAYTTGEWGIKYEHEHGNILPAIFGNNLDEGRGEGFRHAGGFDFNLLKSYLNDMGLKNIRRLRKSQFQEYANWELAVKAEKP